MALIYWWQSVANSHFKTGSHTQHIMPDVLPVFVSWKLLLTSAFSWLRKYSRNVRRCPHQNGEINVSLNFFFLVGRIRIREAQWHTVVRIRVRNTAMYCTVSGYHTGLSSLFHLCLGGGGGEQQGPLYAEFSTDRQILVAVIWVLIMWRSPSHHFRAAMLRIVFRDLVPFWSGIRDG